MTQLDRNAIGRGTAVAFVVALPAVVLQNAVDERSSLRGLLFLLIALGFGAGGYVAGKAEPRRGMTHGAIAALGACVAVLVVGLLVRVARGQGVRLASIPLPLIIALSCGTVGGYVAFRLWARDNQAVDQ